MNKEHTFEDGGSIEWIDRETLRYRDSKGSVGIWVDFEPGPFSRGRIVHESSIRHSRLAESTREELSDEVARVKSIEKMRAAYARQRSKRRVAP